LEGYVLAGGRCSQGLPPTPACVDCLGSFSVKNHDMTSFEPMKRCFTFWAALISTSFLVSLIGQCHRYWNRMRKDLILIFYRQVFIVRDERVTMSEG
jgi:hypothetical protein